MGVCVYVCVCFLLMCLPLVRQLLTMLVGKIMRSVGSSQLFFCSFHIWLLNHVSIDLDFFGCVWIITIAQWGLHACAKAFSDWLVVNFWFCFYATVCRPKPVSRACFDARLCLQHICHDTKLVFLPFICNSLIWNILQSSYILCAPAV